MPVSLHAIEIPQHMQRGALQMHREYPITVNSHCEEKDYHQFCLFILHKGSPLCAHKHRHTYLHVLIQSSSHWIRRLLLSEFFIVSFPHFYCHWNSFVLPTVLLLSVQIELYMRFPMCVCICACVCLCEYTNVDLTDSLVGHWTVINTRTR